jgi:hypothetical protein
MCDMCKAYAHYEYKTCPRCGRTLEEDKPYKKEQRNNDGGKTG